MSEAAAEPTMLGNSEAETQGATGDSGEQSNASWYEGLSVSEENQSYLDKQGFKDFDNVIKSNREANKMLSDSTRIPDFKTATDEVTANFWTNMGKPDEATKYDLSMPEGMDEGFKYDGEFANAFKGMAHEANLTQSQADAVHSGYVKAANDMQIAQVKAMQEQFDTNVTNSNKVLAESWGELGSDAFKAEQENAFKAIKAGGDGLMAELKASGTLGQNGEVLHPETIKAFAMIGKRVNSEGGQLNGAGTVVGNPFSTKTENLTMQMNLYKNDRAQYDSLKASAIRD